MRDVVSHRGMRCVNKTFNHRIAQYTTACQDSPDPILLTNVGMIWLGHEYAYM